MSFLAELKRRNVIRMAGLYLVAAWLVVQIAETLLPAFDVPGWVLRATIILLAIGFIPALIFAWVFELTPEGLKRERDVDRSQSIVDHTARKLDLAVIVLLLCIGALLAWSQFRTATPTDATEHADAARSEPATASGTPAAADQAVADYSIAVLPFVDMSQARDQEYFSDGLSEELLNLLAQIPQLRVIARTSSFSFKGKDADLATIAKALGVSNVLEGSVRSSGNRLRITAQLIRASDASHLWSQTYDRELTDVFAVQDEIANAVVEALKVQLLPTQQVTNPYRSSHAEAHNQYLLGRQITLAGRPGAFSKALVHFRKAIELDPGYAAAHAALSTAELYQADSSGDEVGKQRSLDHASKAIELAPRLVDGYLARAENRVFVARDLDRALADVQQALAINAGDARVHEGYARVLIAYGRVPEAMVALRTSAELNPLSASSWSMLGRALNALGQHAEAEATLQRAANLTPGSDYVLFHLGVTYLLQGRADEALAEFRKWDNSNNLGRCAAGVAMAEYTLGRREQSEQALQSIIAREASNAAYQIAEVHAWRGELDEAMAWLERAREQNDGGLSFVRADPLLAKLSDDPRFAAFLDRQGLPTPTP